MNHPLCDSCQTARFCSLNGCIPEQDEPLSRPERIGWAIWIAVIALSLFSAGALVGGAFYLISTAH